MITPEQIHDALSLLPEELLAPVDAMRCSRRNYWKPVAAVAACLALAVGLSFAFPGAVTQDSAVPENGMGAISDSIEQESQTEESLSAIVSQVHEDHLVVTWITRPAGDAPETAKVYFDELEDIPQFMQGQKLRIYCKATDSPEELHPHRIKITEN